MRYSSIQSYRTGSIRSYKGFINSVLVELDHYILQIIPPEQRLSPLSHKGFINSVLVELDHYILQIIPPEQRLSPLSHKGFINSVLVELDHYILQIIPPEQRLSPLSHLTFPAKFYNHLIARVSGFTSLINKLKLLRKSHEVPRLSERQNFRAKR